MENAWNRREPGAPFEVEFDDYYGAFDKTGMEFVTPMGGVPKHTDPNIEGFVEKLFAWSRIHNLDEAWCREHAYETLELWHTDRDRQEERVWAWGARLPLYSSGSTASRPDFEYPAFVFEYFTYYPCVGLRPELRQSITKEFERQLDSFFDKREQEAEKQGWCAPPQKYAQHHFTWLIDYQVNKLSKHALAKKYKVDRKTIIDGLKSAADCLKLTLRK
jgi:hypothetical protein